ncbi:hypothetical protein POM88_012301 [Heracleum sosnowskyi]|uniref:Uncharacterized protein n=1 Tax=Heracleum sosnowskyi TaxID=360622 RepID=A0AAD8IWH3_9APIA|nr:hypothetical protein POM88_012301 [Heracleum sosnowskyi]
MLHMLGFTLIPRLFTKRFTDLEDGVLCFAEQEVVGCDFYDSESMKAATSWCIYSISPWNMDNELRGKIFARHMRGVVANMEVHNVRAQSSLGAAEMDFPFDKISCDVKRTTSRNPCTGDRVA